MISITASSTAALRHQRDALLARYDNGAISPAVFAAIRKLEIEIAWREHARHHELRVESTR